MYPPTYIYTDEAGYQHVYYLTGPYVIMPVSNPTTTISPEEYVTPPNDNVNNQEEETASAEQADSSYDFINKPYEEWTQEDYARYYGDC